MVPPDQYFLKKMVPRPIFPEKNGPPDQYSLKKMVPPDQNSMENWSIVGPNFHEKIGPPDQNFRDSTKPLSDEKLI